MEVDEVVLIFVFFSIFFPTFPSSSFFVSEVTRGRWTMKTTSGRWTMKNEEEEEVRKKKRKTSTM